MVKKLEVLYWWLGDLYADNKIKPLHMLPKSSVHVKICDGETKWIHFLIQDNDLLSDFHDKYISKVDSNHICLAVIILNSALDKDGNYFPQLFFKKV